jgi:hypothetical protein
VWLLRVEEVRLVQAAPVKREEAAQVLAVLVEEAQTVDRQRSEEILELRVMVVMVPLELAAVLPQQVRS